MLIRFKFNCIRLKKNKKHIKYVRLEFVVTYHIKLYIYKKEDENRLMITLFYNHDGTNIEKKKGK